MHYYDPDQSIEITGAFKIIYGVIHYQENLKKFTKAEIIYLRVWAKGILVSFLTSCLSSRSWECDSVSLSFKLLNCEAEIIREFLG